MEPGGVNSPSTGTPASASPNPFIDPCNPPARTLVDPSTEAAREPPAHELRGNGIAPATGALADHDLVLGKGHAVHG